jgi:coproporphyrinogen III oxidase-like Fe-S oxidoreductase
LQAAIATGVDHISTYGLTFEKGAAFWGRRQRGQVLSVDVHKTDDPLAVFDRAIELLGSH